MADVLRCLLAQRYADRRWDDEDLCDRQRIEAFWSGHPDPVLFATVGAALKAAKKFLPSDLRKGDVFDDILAETILKIVVKIRRAQESGNAFAIENLSGYAYRVAENAVKEWVCAQGPAVVSLTDDREPGGMVHFLPDPEPNAFRRYLLREMVRIALEAKRKLAAAQQAAVARRVAAYMDNGGPARGKTRTPDHLRQAACRGFNAIRGALKDKGYSARDLD